MISPELLLENKGNIELLCDMVTKEDILLLVEWLTDKNDDIRYTSFLVLKEISNRNSDVYPYWDVFVQMIQSNNSYHRSIGLMLLSENVKWDKENRMLSVIDDYLYHCDDKKFITARQSVQGLKNIIALKTELHDRIADFLMNIDVFKRKESQQKLLLTDIVFALIEIQKITPRDRIGDYLLKAVKSGILDRKTIKAIEDIK